MRFWRVSANRTGAGRVGFAGAATTGAAGADLSASSAKVAIVPASSARHIPQMAICCIENPRLTRCSFRK